MTPSELKYNYEYNNPTGHFFDRKTMSFFGDTMKNFGCYFDQYPDNEYVLYRKKPVKHGLTGGFRFDAKTFNYKGTI